MRRYSPERKVEILGRLLLILSIADNNVSTFATESRDDALETRFFACLTLKGIIGLINNVD